MSYTVGWESGSIRAGTIKFHRKKYASKQRALKVAARASRLTKGYVIVSNRIGVEVAECYAGRCALGTPYERRRR